MYPRDWNLVRSLTYLGNSIRFSDSPVDAPLTLRPTIKDVAREANVSHSTVSYILNNTPHADRISEQTKQRVFEAVKRLGYKSNPIGRDLQRGYTNQVTLLIVSWNLACSHAATAMAISRAAVERDLELTVHVANSDQEAELFLKRHVTHSLGGILVLWDSPALKESCIRQIAAEGVPVVNLLPDTDLGISIVTADREDAGLHATKHLIELGHLEIGCICDLDTRPSTTLCKLAGYKRALAQAGISADPKWIESVTEFGFEGGYKALPRMLERCPQLTGFFCINDSMALGAIQAANDMGKKCPEDISVIGFGDSPEGGHWRPKLTTFSLSSNRVAAGAIARIIELRQTARHQPQTILIPEDLLIRQSTGPAPRR
jgi:LacI family transcriptional regulator, repressor for deo operon, udp, cdd, tsx, nupC, and nupG